MIVYLTTEDTEEHRDYNDNVNGALIIDKPAGLTSHDVVARIRKIIGEKRVGHTGTLDPFATGVLVVLVGRATRLAQFLSGAEKEYEATIRLGYATDTGDVTGQPVENEFHAKVASPQSLRKEEIDATITSLRGEIEQMPPMYSAKKIAGQKLYELARRGQEVERQPIRVTIHEIAALPASGELLKQNEDGTQNLGIRVVCSAGTYIRVLAEDVGRQLGTGAHLAELRRTRAGRFGIEQAVTLDELGKLTASELERVLISPDAALLHLPSIALDDEQARRTLHGIDLRITREQADSWHDRDAIRLTLEGELMAVGRFDASQGTVHPAVVLGTD
ncbi:MAG TPA: tRNA pseudouridine(55) synthase TruB [Pyrinomonadaceae bacterium]|jgi:tRNA pseudouridine55 synthase